MYLERIDYSFQTQPDGLTGTGTELGLKKVEEVTTRGEPTS